MEVKQKNKATDCPRCHVNILLCKCPSGSAAGDENSKSDDQDNADKKSKLAAEAKATLERLTGNPKADALINPGDCQLWPCAFFASTEKQPTPRFENSNDVKDDEQENAAATPGMRMGMKMGDVG